MAKQKSATVSDANLKGFASIKQTVALLTLVVMFIIAVFGEIIAVAIFSAEQEETMQKSMRAVARAYSIMMNNTPAMEPAELRSFLASNLSGIKINDIESSYIMVVNRDSVVEFHGGDSSRIGNVTINEVLTGITQQMRNKTIEYGTGGYASYVVSGVEKFSSYYVTTDGEYVVCAVMDKKDVTAAVVAKFLRISILIYFVALVIIAIISYLIVGRVVRPVKVIEQLINRVAKFDLHFSDEGEVHEVMLRRDEFGVIGRAVRSMIDNLTEVLNRLNMSSEDLTNKATNLKDGMGQVSENSSDNSATTEELAAGMQETTATTETINATVTSIADTAKTINEHAEEGAHTASETQKKALDIAGQAENSKNKSEQIFMSVRAKSEAAIEESKAVSKINELTENIKSIADQTNLLALNASIEAARAGESGKGFAVVAEEIGRLASQSGETVESISSIVKEVNVAVSSMAECLSEMLDFMQNTVAVDYDSFTNVARQYNSDSKYFEDSMNSISSQIADLTESITSIQEAISGINTTISESATGITDVAQKTTDIVELVSDANNIADQSLQLSQDLKGIVGEFKF